MPKFARDGAEILLVTRNFPPLVGGMENVNERLFLELSSAFQIGLCGPGGSGAYLPEGTALSETRIAPLPLFLVRSLVRAVAMARRLRPKLVIAGSGLTLPAAWLAARLCGARLGVFLHGLDIIAPSRIYQLVWPRFFKACDLVLVNSAYTRDLAKARGVLPERVHVLHPGTSIPVLDPGSRARFRAGLGIGSEPVLLSVGRLTERKGLAEFVARSLPLIRAVHPEVQLLVVGEEAGDALTSTGASQRDRILAAARASGISESVRFIGRLSESELSEAYQSADVHVFPVLKMKGDVEGFGMVALESAAHGLRTVAFEVGGIPDAVDVPATGTLVPSGDYRKFSDAVINVLQPGSGVTQDCSAFAKAKSWDVFGTRVRALISAEIGDG